MTGAEIIPIKKLAEATSQDITHRNIERKRKEVGEMWANGEISAENKNLSLMWSIKR